MNDLPITDINNAIRYAEQFIIKHRFDNQHNESRWYIPAFRLEELPEDPSFYIPKVLREKFKLYTLKLDKDACHQLSCFRYMPEGQPCTNTSPPIDFMIANQLYHACQPACQKNWIDGTIPFIDEVEFREGKCERKLSLYKKWCLFPNTRSNEPTLVDVPPFKYDDLVEKCKFTPEYCEIYGLDISKDDTCVRSGIQAFVEDYLVGKTIYRSYRITQARSGSRQKRATSEDQMKDDVVQMLSEGSFDAGIEAAFWGARKMALKSIPLYSSPSMKLFLAQLQTVYGKQIVKHAVMGSIIRSVQTGMTAQLAIKAAAFLGTASTVVGVILLGIQLTGIVVDIIDPLRLNDRVDEKYLDELKTAFKIQLHSVLKGNTEITPQGIMEIMSGNDYTEAERMLLIDHMAQYLFHLEITADGVDLNYDPGLSLEEYLNRWALLLHNQSPLELEKKMDTYFTQFSLLSSILLGLYLAVSI